MRVKVETPLDARWESARILDLRTGAEGFPRPTQPQ